jgi:hypothetical protein
MSARTQRSGRTARRRPATKVKAAHKPARAAAHPPTRAGRIEVDDEQPEVHHESATAIAAEAQRTGVLPDDVVISPEEQEIPGEDALLRVGDPDDDPLFNEYSGEDAPGGSTPTPDQSNVDEIGKAYGLEEPEAEPLRGAEEILRRRDQSRKTRRDE